MFTEIRQTVTAAQLGEAVVSLFDRRPGEDIVIIPGTEGADYVLVAGDEIVRLPNEDQQSQA